MREAWQAEKIVSNGCLHNTGEYYFSDDMCSNSPPTEYLWLKKKMAE